MLDGTFHGLRKASLPNGSAYDSLMSSRLDELGIFCSTKRMEHPVLASRAVSGNPSIRLQQHVQKNPARAIHPDPDSFLCILMAGMAIKSACPSSAAARDGQCLQNGVVLICHAISCRQL